MAEVSSPELAVMADLSRARIYQLAAEGMPGKIRRGVWDSDAAMEWINERRESSEASGRPHKGPIVSHEAVGTRADLIALQCEAQKIRNGVLSADLLLRDSAQRIFSEMIAEQIAVGDRWVAMGRTGKDQADRREIWHELRGKMHRSIERVAAAFSVGEDVATSRVRLR